MNAEEEKTVIEAALFMAPRSMELSFLKSFIPNAKETDIIYLLNLLKQEYDERKSAVEIFIDLENKTAGMRVRSTYLEKVKDLATEAEFHKGVQKTLALIAFKQPIKQSEIIRYRNNKAYDHIKVLEEQGFIRRVPSGRSFILTTTKKFAEYFNVNDFKQQNKETEETGNNQ